MSVDQAELWLGIMLVFCWSGIARGWLKVSRKQGNCSHDFQPRLIRHDGIFDVVRMRCRFCGKGWKP